MHANDRCHHEIYADILEICTDAELSTHQLCIKARIHQTRDIEYINKLANLSFLTVTKIEKTMKRGSTLFKYKRPGKTKYLTLREARHDLKEMFTTSEKGKKFLIGYRQLKNNFWEIMDIARPKK